MNGTGLNDLHQARLHSPICRSSRQDEALFQASWLLGTVVNLWRMKFPSTATPAWAFHDEDGARQREVECKPYLRPPKTLSLAATINAQRRHDERHEAKDVGGTTEDMTRLNRAAGGLNVNV